jgi:hypothetical protein
MDELRPDIAYLASPFLLGEQVRNICATMGIPTVANYQRTDVSGFLDFYGLGSAKSLSQT